MKKVLLISVIPGNMETLYDYYKREVSSNYQVEMLNCYDFYKNKYKGYFTKIKFMIKKYDLVIADYPTQLLKRGRKSIYLDHGSGLKMMPGKNEVYNKKIIQTSKIISNSDYFITQSDREKQILYSWLPYVNKNINFISLGQPRNDKLFDEEYKSNCKSELYKKYKIHSNKKLILLAPTWRGYSYNFESFFNEEDLKRLDYFLGLNNFIIMYRPHYLEDILGKDKFNELDNFIYVNNNMENDAQKVVAASDILISDYSGILTEFLALNKPAIFLDIDTEKYSDIRGLAINYYNDVHTPGPKVKSIDEIITYISELVDIKDKYKDIREKSIKYYYKYYDGNSSKRIWKLIVNII